MRRSSAGPPEEPGTQTQEARAFELPPQEDRTLMNIKHPDRLYKTERLNYIVNRMRVRQDITPTKLAEELHVSERTIYRDLRFLEKGQALRKRYSRREGRYLLETELNLPPITLTPSEALALYTAAANPALANDNFYASDLRSGLRKIDGALSPDSAKGGRADQDGKPISTRESIQRPTLEMIRRAMRSNRKLRIRYAAPGSDHEQMLVVSPYDLRQNNGSWYLVANSPEHGGVRTFKIGRVRAGEILNDRFRFPRRFSADACFAKAWEAAGGSDDETTVQVRFLPVVADVVAENCARQFDKLEKQPDDSLIGITTVNSLNEIAWWILSYGSAAEVLAPPDLRAEFARTARAMAALYAPAPSSP